MFEKARRSLARWIAPVRAPRRPVFGRMYQAAKSSRMTVGFGSSGNSSADAELSSSLTQLRARSRQLIRDAAYAKRARQLVVNNVIGTGVGLQAQVKDRDGQLQTRVNDDIEFQWAEWATADSCHTGGAMHFSDFERACMAQVFDAGEVFIRLHFRKFGKSRVPLCLELIEAERVADELAHPGPVVGDARVRMGIEVDEFQRPIAYWIRSAHPGDVQTDVRESQRYDRVPASEIIHLRIVDRWPQTRGEPWLHAVARTLFDADGYAESELYAARVSAMTVFSIERNPEFTGDPDEPLGEEENGQDTFDVESGMGMKMAPGEKLNMHSPTRPNTAIDPFLRYMLRQIAVGTGVSYASLSGDYSQSNYSSSRLALQDDRDLWRVMQMWWLRNFRQPLHRIWMNQAVLAKALAKVSVESFYNDMGRFSAVLFKCRGWSWIDPTKEVAAYKEAIAAGLTNRTEVIAATAGGMDIEDIDDVRAQELKNAKEKGLEFDTDPAYYMADAKAKKAAAKPPATPPPKEDEDEEPTARHLRAVSFGAK